MLTRSIITMLVVIPLVSGTLIAQPNKTAKQADPQNSGMIVLEMSGELGVEYSKLIGLFHADWNTSGRSISVPAHVSYRLADGRVVVEHSSAIAKDGKTTGLVTFSTTIVTEKLEKVVIPKGTQTYLTPTGKNDPPQKAGRTKAITTHKKLKLSELKDVELRSWKLEKTLGD